MLLQIGNCYTYVEKCLLNMPRKKKTFAKKMFFPLKCCWPLDIAIATAVKMNRHSRPRCRRHEWMNEWCDSKFKWEELTPAVVDHEPFKLHVYDDSIITLRTVYLVQLENYWEFALSSSPHRARPSGSQLFYLYSSRLLIVITVFI